MPLDPFLQTYSFLDTNWDSEEGDAPAGFSNLLSVPVWYGNALLLDTTNTAPAFLNYNIVEADQHTNLDLSAGALKFIFICNWASADTNQNGSGPGELGYLLAAGDFSSNSPEGLWAIYFDSGGTNIYFGGVSNSTSTVFVSAPISWPSNSVHLIGLSYSTNSMLYIDGQLVATGGPVTIVPATNTWTNGFYVGSDNAGLEQARGIFCYLELDDTNVMSEFGDTYFTHSWTNLSNAYAAWQGGGGGVSDFTTGSGGSLGSLGSSSGCATGTAAYMEDVSVAGNTFVFTIAGGTNGVSYDVFSTTNLNGPKLTNSAWTWLGQGTNCGIYSVTNQISTQTFYLLGNPIPASDGSGLTQAYENLIGISSDGYGTPNLWYLWQGLSPVISGIGVGGDDADGDGLLNYQEYLYGTNPQVSEGFAAWVSEPEITSGIP